jgi:hypothetical protein
MDFEGSRSDWRRDWELAAQPNIGFRPKADWIYAPRPFGAWFDF